MEINREFTTVTDHYTVTDGPLMQLKPHYGMGQFRVERMQVVHVNGELRRVYVRGPRTTVKGGSRLTFADRTLLAGELPGWVREFLEADAKDRTT